MQIIWGMWSCQASGGPPSNYIDYAVGVTQEVGRCKFGYHQFTDGKASAHSGSRGRSAGTQVWNGEERVTVRTGFPGTDLILNQGFRCLPSKPLCTHLMKALVYFLLCNTRLLISLNAPETLPVLPLSNH